MTKAIQLDDSYSIEKYHEFGGCYAISILNRSGFSEYNIRLYHILGGWSDGDDIHYHRLSKNKGDFKIISCYEDAEIGLVEFQIGNSFYSVSFGHDGDEPFTACLNEVAMPNGWDEQKTAEYLFPDIDKNKIKLFMENRWEYFINIHESFDDARKAFMSYLKANVFNHPALFRCNLENHWA